MKHANPYAGLVGSLTPAELENLSDAVEERRLRDETGFGALAEAAEGNVQYFAHFDSGIASR